MTLRESARAPDRDLGSGNLVMLAHGTKSVSHSLLHTLSFSHCHSRTHFLSFYHLSLSVPHIRTPTMMKMMIFRFLVMILTATSTQTRNAIENTSARVANTVRVVRATHRKLKLGAIYAEQGMWARKCGAPVFWPSRVKVGLNAIFTGAIGYTAYQFMSGGDVGYLNMSQATASGIICLTSWPQRASITADPTAYFYEDAWRAFSKSSNSSEFISYHRTFTTCTISRFLSLISLFFFSCFLICVSLFFTNTSLFCFLFVFFFPSIFLLFLFSVASLSLCLSFFLDMTLRESARAPDRDLGSGNLVMLAHGTKSVSHSLLHTLSFSHCHSRTHFLSFYHLSLSVPHIRTPTMMKMMIFRFLVMILTATSTQTRNAIENTSARVANTVRVVRATHRKLKLGAIYAEQGMWARKCGAPVFWPSRVKVGLNAIFTGAIGYTAYQFMSGGDVGYLNMSQATASGIICLTSWPQRASITADPTAYFYEDAWRAFSKSSNSSEFISDYQCPFVADSGDTCNSVSVPLEVMQRDLYQPVGDDVGVSSDILYFYAHAFLGLGVGLWLAITTHDLALLHNVQKDWAGDSGRLGVEEHRLPRRAQPALQTSTFDGYHPRRNL